MYRFVLIMLSIISLQCKKSIDDEIPIVMEEDPVEESVDSKIKIVWKVPLSPDTLKCSSAQPVLMGEYVMFTQTHCIEKEIVRARNRVNGELVWEWDENTRLGNVASTHSIFFENGKLLYNMGPELIAINAQTGITEWKDEAQPLIGARFFGVYDNHWFKEYDPPGVLDTISWLWQGNILNGTKRLVYTQHGKDGYAAYLCPPVVWINDSNDTILVFQNRSYNYSEQDGKIDLVVYNLTKGSTLYEIEDLTESGNSNVRPPVIWDEKIYFAGAFNMYCIDLHTGEIIWTKGPHQMVTSNWFIEEGKLIINPDNRTLYALDPYTGDVIWEHTDSGSTCSDMVYYDGLVYFTSLGRGRLYAVDINTGEHIRAEDSPNKGGDFYDGVAIDPERGVLYTSDGYFAMCIRLPER